MTHNMDRRLVEHWPAAEDPVEHEADDPVAGSAACARCGGEGRIANSDRGEPWSAWTSLPFGADLAVRLGHVAPIDCPDCAGTGREGA